MPLNKEQFDKLQPIINKTMLHPHEAKELWEVFCQSEGFSLGSPTCPDCVFKMMDRMKIRFNEFEAEQKAKETELEKAEREVKEYQKKDSEEKS